MAVANLPPYFESPIQEVRYCYGLEGNSSRDLVEQFDIANAQWRNRPSLQEEPKDASDAINHVPFKKVGTIKVRFKKSHPMKPRVIDIEEFEPE